MMRYLQYPSGYLLVMIAALLASCTTTQLNAVWKDPAYNARPAKIMVIGMAKDPLRRRVFEDEFVAQLKTHGTDAIASYTVLPDNQQSDRGVIAAKVKESGADTILITRLVSKKTVKTYVPPTPYFPPPYYGSWPDYYGYGYSHMYAPGYIAKDEYATVETNLYEAKNDKLVWAASSETGISDSDPTLVQNFVGVMVTNMIEQGLLGK